MRLFGLSFSALTRRLLFAAAVVLCSAFFPYTQHGVVEKTGACGPQAPRFTGYTFLLPDVINKNAAYAPFFLRFDDYYDQMYFQRDLQRDDNIWEWIDRFCNQAAPEDVSYVVYEAGIDEMVDMRNVALDKTGRKLLPYTLEGNTFAEMLIFNKCTEVIDYLIYAKKCEPYVIAYGDGWTIPERDPATMQELIGEGLGRFKQTESMFVRQRYTYQVIRLAHYAGFNDQAIELYNYLMPKMDRKKPSIMYYWTLGHLAGALQGSGKYHEAAYRYSLIFRNCPSKRKQAFYSFRIRNDQDWKKALQLCQNPTETATLFMLRAANSPALDVADIQRVYDLDPSHPQLDLLLVSDVQKLEKRLLLTTLTEKKFGVPKGAPSLQNCGKYIIDLQQLVRNGLRSGKLANPRLWQGMKGYLELLAGDFYAAGKSFDRAADLLEKDDDYDAVMKRQLSIWRLLLEVQQINPGTYTAEEKAFRLSNDPTFKTWRDFQPFLRDKMSSAYAVANRPGKALLTAYDHKALLYNPDMAIIDDLLLEAGEDNPMFLERMMQMDTNPDRIRAMLLEMKATMLFARGEPEAALAMYRRIPATQMAELTQFAPFVETLGEKVHRRVSDTLLLNRRQIVERILDYEFKAKSAAALDDPAAGYYYYLIGLAYYNMSYFGYEWEVMDAYRSGANWTRLASGPVFPLYGSPSGNRENTDVTRALGYFEKAYKLSKTPEIAARAAYMAARCEQKMWFYSPDCQYKPGSNLIPILPDASLRYYRVLDAYRDTDFYKKAVRECKWLEAYVN